MKRLVLSLIGFAALAMLATAQVGAPKTGTKTPPKGKTELKGGAEKKTKGLDDVGIDGTPLLKLPAGSKGPTWFHSSEGRSVATFDASALHFMPLKSLRTALHDKHCACEENVLQPKGFQTTPLKLVAGTEKASWNSAAGRIRSAKMLHIGAASGVGPKIELLPAGPSDPCTPKVWAGSGSFDVSSTIFKATVLDPQAAFAGQVPAKAFAKSVGPFMPFYLPFKENVVLSQGWYYDKGTPHAAFDYAIKDESANGDATFKVTAIAPGKVVAVFWTNLSGNVVVVQHTAPNGFKYLSIYKHLRDGQVHDGAKAKAIDWKSMSAGSNQDKAKKYVAFATGNSGHVSWGKVTDKIKVTVGQTVSAGTLLAHAGNTGYGGAGSGLNDDGSPKSKRGNVHLHFEFAAELKGTPGTYVTIDPYGVYAEADDNGCYDFLRDTEYPRFFAPFYANFHGVPLAVFLKYFNYYPDMNWDLRTISVHESPKGLLASGSFQKNLPGGWYLGVNMDSPSHQDWFDKYAAKGYVPRQTQVTITKGGAPRYTALWGKLEPGESVIRRRELDNKEWTDHWKKYVGDKKWRVDDYFGYVAGSPHQAATFTSDEGRPFKLLRNRSAKNLNDEAPQHKADGYSPVGISVVELPEGRRYNVILRKQPGSWKLFIGLSPTEYQEQFKTEAEAGYELHRIQGYANSTHYAAIFHRP